MAKKKKNILFLHPRIQNTYWGFNHALYFIGKKAAHIPLGATTVAAMLPEEYDVSLIDMNVESLGDEDILWADAVFISSMVLHKGSLDEIISRIIKLREENTKDIPIVAGGPYPTQYFDKIYGVDHFVLGEAESGVLEAFLKDFEEGEAKKVYVRPVIRKRKGEKEIDQESLTRLVKFFEKEKSDILVVEAKPPMHLSPIPRFDLLKISEYGSMSVQLSRGCPYNCEFCNESTLYGHKPRLKSAEQLVSELEATVNLGYNGADFVVDDDFVGNKREVKAILPSVVEFQEKYGYPLSLYTEADISLSEDDELMGLMRDAGFNMVFVGLESPNKEVLISMGKNQNVRIDLSTAVRKIQSYGMEVAAGFIVGNDEDPDDICNQIFKFCQEEGIVTAMVGLLTAVKGSELYERLKRENRLREDFDGNNTHNFSLNFDPLPGKDEKKIINDYKNLLERLYDPSGKNYFERCYVLQDRLGHHPKHSRRVGTTEVGALVKSLFWQSFSSYRTNYLRFISHSLLYHIRTFPEAIRMAVCGEHFIHITKDSLKTDEIKEDLVEKVNDYKKRLSVAFEALADSGQRLRQVSYETKQFLKKAERRIRKLPGEYRKGLMELYEGLVQSIESLFLEKGRLFN